MCYRASARVTYVYSSILVNIQEKVISDINYVCILRCIENWAKHKHNQ